MAKSRDELLAMLGIGAPQPTGPDRRLILPTEETVREIAPDQADDFGKRRDALFDSYNALLAKFSQLTNAEFCRYKLLEALFGVGSLGIGDCWQKIYVIRADTPVDLFDTAVNEIIASRCVQVHNP